MAPRGPYAKGVAKRAAILDTALTVIDRDGFSNATVKELADAVGLSQNGLLHYFGSKDELFVEVLRHRDEAVAATINAATADFSWDLRTRILDAVAVNVAASGMSDLVLNMVAGAATESHPAHEFFTDRYATFRDYTRTALDAQQQRGSIPSDRDTLSMATLITAAFDGLQMQWMYDHSIDVRSRMADLLDALGVVDLPVDSDLAESQVTAEAVTRSRDLSRAAGTTDDLSTLGGGVLSSRA